MPSVVLACMHLSGGPLEDPAAQCVQDFKVSRSKTTDDGRAGSCMDCSKRKVKTPKEPRPPAAEKRKRAKKAEALPAAPEQALALAPAPAAAAPEALCSRAGRGHGR